MTLLVVAALLLGTANNVFAALPSYPDDEGVILVDLTSGDVIYTQNADQRFYPASTTKLMTALVTVEQVDNLSEQVTVGEEIASIGYDSSVADLEQGEIYTYEELLYGLLLPSGNDAANVLAANVGRKIAGNPALDYNQAIALFVNAMNTKAEELGCTGTHFANPHGLHDTNHYTTPNDLSIIGRAAFSEPVIAEVEGTTIYRVTTNTGTEKEWRNSDMLLYKDAAAYGEIIEEGRTDNPYYNERAEGGKTGFTEEAGRTFVYKASDDGHDILGVIMHTDENGIFEQADQTIDAFYNDYTLKYFTEGEGYYISETLGNVHLGSEWTLNARTDGAFAITVLKGEEASYTASMEWDSSIVNTDWPWPRLMQSVDEGDVVGTLTVYKNGEAVKTTSLYAANTMQVREPIEYLYLTGMILVPIAIMVGAIVGIVKAVRRKGNRNGIK